MTILYELKPTVERRHDVGAVEHKQARARRVGRRARQHRLPAAGRAPQQQPARRAYAWVARMGCGVKRCGGMVGRAAQQQPAPRARAWTAGWCDAGWCDRGVAEWWGGVCRLCACFGWQRAPTCTKRSMRLGVQRKRPSTTIAVRGCNTHVYAGCAVCGPGKVCAV
jgi:hypothetical protein